MKKIAHASESIIRIAAILFSSMPAFGTPERQSNDERAAPPPVNAMITHITFDLPQHAAPPIGNPTIPDETDRLLAECWNLVETGMAGVEDSSRSLAILDSSHISSSTGEFVYVAHWRWEPGEGLLPRAAESRNCGVEREWRVSQARDGQSGMLLDGKLEAVTLADVPDLPDITAWKSAERVSMPVFSTRRTSGECAASDGRWILIGREDSPLAMGNNGPRARYSFARVDRSIHQPGNPSEPGNFAGVLEWIDVPQLEFARWCSAPGALPPASDARSQATRWLESGVAEMKAATVFHSKPAGKALVESIDEVIYATHPLVGPLLQESCGPKGRGFAETRPTGRSAEFEITRIDSSPSLDVRMEVEWVSAVRQEPAADAPVKVDPSDPFAANEPDDPFAESSRKPAAEPRAGTVAFHTSRLSTRYIAEPGIPMLVGTCAPPDTRGLPDNATRRLVFLTVFPN